MEIPMQDVINSYRQQLSDVHHTLTLRDLHIKYLEKNLKEAEDKIETLRMENDGFRLANEDLSEDEEEDWTDNPYGHNDR